MFSNFSEYQDFLEECCSNCKRYVPWEEAPDKTCPIEEALSTCAISGEGFPEEHVILNQRGEWECREFEEKE